LAISKKTQIIAVILVVALVISGIVVVTNSGNDDSTSSEVTDALGREVSIEEVPERIVTCSPDITEDVYSVGAGSLLVGVTEYCDYPNDVVSRKANGTLSEIGGYSDPNVEKIVSLSPDLVLISAGVQAQVDMITQFDELGIPVVALYEGDNISQVYDNIKLVGKLTDKEISSLQAVAQLSTTLSWISSIVSGSATSPSVVQAVWIDPVYVAAGNTYVQDLFDAVSAENPYESQDGWPSVTTESILEEDPDVIILTSSMMMSTPEALLQYLRSDPIWAETSAVQNNRIYVLTDQAENLFNRPSPRLAEAVELLADILYPQLMNVTIPNVLGDDYTDYLDSSISYSTPIPVIDASGATVSLDKTPTRIVSLSPSITEMVYSLDLEGNLVGVTDYCDWPADVPNRIANGTLTSIGGYFTPNQEAIIDLDPDLVIVDSGVSAQLEIVPTLESMNINVLVLYKGSNISEIKENYDLIGNAVGRAYQADKVIASMDITLGWVSSKLAGTSEIRSVMYCVWIDPIYVAGNSTFVQNMMDEADLTNSFEDLNAWPVVSMEAVLEANPDVVIIPVMYGLSESQTLSYIRNDSVWSTLKAVQENNVFVLTGQALNLFSRPTDRVVQGVELLAMMAYPGAFNITIGNVIGDDYTSYVVLSNGSANEEKDDGISISVYDALGRQVSLSQPALRIVSCEPSTTETIYALGMGSCIVAVSNNCDYPTDVVERKASGALKTAGSYTKPNVEAIVNATPDLVILDAGVKGQVALVSQLENLGITTLVLYKATNIGQIFNNLELIGNLNGRSVTAHKAISEMVSKLMFIQQKLDGISPTAKVSAFMAVSLNPTYVAGNSTYGNNMISVVGGTNPFSNLNGWAVVSTEAIVQANPDVIILTATMTGLNASETLAFMKSDSIWGQLNAVKNDRIYFLEGSASSIFSRPATRLPDSVALLAMMLYPEQFDESLPNVIGNEYTGYLDW